MKKLLITTACLAGLMMCQMSNAISTPLPINDPYGVVINPANPTLETAALNSAITAYNTANGTSLPGSQSLDLTPQLIGGATNIGGQGVMPDPTPKSFTIDFSVEPETYVGLTWDGRNGGTLFYYVEGYTGTYTFNSPTFPSGQTYGLSHYAFFGPGTSVPDGGTTVMLLGLGILGLGMLKRRIVVA